MPFTLAHPAVLLPLGRTGLPMVALAAGAMAPDLPLFSHAVPGLPSYSATHSAPGVVGVDLLVSMVMVAAWVALLRDALVDAAPDAVRERLAEEVTWSRRASLLSPVAAVLGSASHVLWDDFTHAGRWGTAHVTWLHTRHGLLVGHQWAQYVSGAVGLTVIAVWCLLGLRRLPRRPRARQVGPAAPMAVVAGAAVVALALARALPLAPHGLHAVAYRGGITGVTGLGVACLVLAVTWQVLRGRASSRRA